LGWLPGVISGRVRPCRPPREPSPPRRPGRHRIERGVECVTLRAQQSRRSLLITVMYQKEHFVVIAGDVSMTVGKTPLVELKRLARGLPCRVVAKLDMRNPC